MAGSCSSSFGEGFPDVLKRSAIEEIIGNYYAYDPFLQSGRRGRELINGHPSEQSISIEHVSNNDPTLYSIPPAVTPLESQVRMEFENGSPVFVTRPPTTQRQKQFNHFQDQPSIQNRENNQEDFDSFINSNRQEDYPEYPPFLNSQQSVKQQQQQRQLLPSSSSTSSKMARSSFPKYVIGVAGEERLDDIFQQPEPQPLVAAAPRQTIFRGQLQSSRRPASDDIVLDESPFAKRSLRYANYDNNGHRRYNRRQSRSYTPRQFQATRKIRNPHYF